MKKRFIASAVGATGAIAATGMYLKDKNNRDKVMYKAKGMKNKLLNNNLKEPFEDAGVPDQSESKDLAQLENSKMVSEGSQFGVQYYNEYKKENTSENEQN
ncbi:hypothetical protein GLV94_19440 [Virgibacillus halodenitrificans]|uniref:YtxH domain-containing protein n=1 Tax=Virgibacillus halodenitrificans TaxID=1482 RepID=A0AAC9NLA3_VIRHA|nr:hypothetical protein [Virgibacillus halodenitrificans]APC48758.1 hypothetical protein BME96_11410 [Virgibacillus halodenitrificans]MBD1224428.1 hypothetical protein [Virgibacillus halodenitrificans]MCG1029779.1 hypothetical protein [Virgibacillus halodenitrificans]MCJ0931336.1 hypothetical protein [Virgibacillus halodenitrificans]MEC2161120.1 hypothetical protein [Virgibacillus halodenitrificans]